MFGPTPLPRTFEASLRDIASDDPRVRASAFADLARYEFDDDSRRSRAVALIERGVLRDEDVRVRAAAVEAAAEWRAVELVPALLMAVEDEAPFVGEIAVRTLGELGDGRALPKLRRLLADERPELRFQAIGAWCKLPHEDEAERYEPVLERMRGETNRKVIVMALRVFDERAEEEAFSAVAVPLESFLRASLDHHETALLAALVLAKRGDAEGRRVVVARLNARPLPGSVPTEDDREAVLVAGRLRWKEAVSALSRRAHGIGRFLADTCATEALVALAALGDARSSRDLEKLARKSQGPAFASLVLMLARARVTVALPWVDARASAVAGLEDAIAELRAASRDR
jgi:hypothetical protein